MILVGLGLLKAFAIAVQTLRCDNLVVGSNARTCGKTLQQSRVRGFQIYKKRVEAMGETTLSHRFAGTALAHGSVSNYTTAVTKKPVKFADKSLSHMSECLLAHRLRQRRKIIAIFAPEQSVGTQTLMAQRSEPAGKLSFARTADSAHHHYIVVRYLFKTGHRVQW